MLSGSRIGNLRIAANFAGQEFVYFLVPGKGGGFLRRSVDVNRMIAALAKQQASVLLKMTDDIATLHSAVIASGSRITFWPLILNSAVGYQNTAKYSLDR